MKLSEVCKRLKANDGESSPRTIASAIEESSSVSAKESDVDPALSQKIEESQALRKSEKTTDMLSGTVDILPLTSSQWTHEEIEALRNAADKHGKRWAAIRDDPEFGVTLAARSSDALKMKWSEICKRIKTNDEKRRGATSTTNLQNENENKLNVSSSSTINSAVELSSISAKESDVDPALIQMIEEHRSLRQSEEATDVLSETAEILQYFR